MTQTQRLTTPEMPEQTAAASRTSVAVAVCTYRRNEPLRVLLEALLVAAEHVRAQASLGVVIVDDNPDGAARAVADEFAPRFELGVQYRHSGKQNLAVARNLSLETAARLAEWVLMTDDDCEPPPRWLAAHLAAQRQTGCDATTGAMLLRAPGAPPWLLNQPFFSDYEMRGEHLQQMNAAGTNNAMIRSAWLHAHPELRFREDLGRTGGEDWVFFRTACRAGMELRFAADASTMGNESPDRLTWMHQLRNRFWLGNCEYFVNTILRDAPKSVLIRRAPERLFKGAARFVRYPREFRYSTAVLARNLGYLAAVFGVRLRHH